MLQTGGIGLYWKGPTGPATFNFTAGTLQAAPSGLTVTTPITLGPAASNIATVDAHGQTVNLNGIPDVQPVWGYLSGPGQLRVIDSVGGGRVVLGNTASLAANYYTGGTTVMSGTLEVVNYQALPTTGVLTVGGPVAVVLNAAAGTLFGSNAVAQSLVVESTGTEIASSSLAADISGSAVLTLVTGVGMVPLGNDRLRSPSLRP